MYEITIYLKQGPLTSTVHKMPDIKQAIDFITKDNMAVECDDFMLVVPRENVAYFRIDKKEVK